MSQDNTSISKVLKKRPSITVFVVFFLSPIFLSVSFFFFLYSSPSPPPTSVFPSVGLGRWWREQGIGGASPLSLLLVTSPSMQ